MVTDMDTATDMATITSSRIDSKRQMSRTIYVLHEYGTAVHYLGLIRYCKNKGYQIKFYEFTIIRKLLVAIYKCDFKTIVKTFKNILFLLRISTTKNKTIVLAIAPLDYRMLFFRWISLKHDVFYHTSWPFWNGLRIVKKPLQGRFRLRVELAWRSFLQTSAKGIFCVTASALCNMRENYSLKGKSRVVYHSVKSEIFFPSSNRRHEKINFLYVGRLEPYKGIDFLLNLVEGGTIPGFHLTIAGFGSLEERVKTFASRFPSVTFLGKVSGIELGDLYRDNVFLISPAIRGERMIFEELFGLTIIEAMSCGTIPIATNHVGPSEIIEVNETGFLLDEEKLEMDLESMITKLLNLHESEIIRISNNCIAASKKFSEESVSKLWSLLA
jgi:glycosyltransferase involved in cell wall biosynthesis